MSRLAPGVAAALAACALAALASPARGEGIPAVIYPVQGDGIERDLRADVQALLHAALLRTARSGGLKPANPPFAQNACGAAATASKECLARVAGSGVVLTAIVGRSGPMLAVLVRAVDGRGRSFGPVRASVDPTIQNAEVLALALANLEEIAASAASAEARKAAGAAGPAPATSLPAHVRSAPAPGPKRAWMRPAGKWATLGGIALLGGAGIVAAMNKSLSEDLDEKYTGGGLTHDDLSSYDKVDTYNALTTGLLVAGGVATVTGVALWAMAPDGPPGHGGMRLGVSGRF